MNRKSKTQTVTNRNNEIKDFKCVKELTRKYLAWCVRESLIIYGAFFLGSILVLSVEDAIVRGMIIGVSGILFWGTVMDVLFKNVAFKEGTDFCGEARRGGKGYVIRIHYKNLNGKKRCFSPRAVPGGATFGFVPRGTTRIYYTRFSKRWIGHRMNGKDIFFKKY